MDMLNHIIVESGHSVDAIGADFLVGRTSSNEFNMCLAQPRTDCRLDGVPSHEYQSQSRLETPPYSNFLENESFESFETGISGVPRRDEFVCQASKTPECVKQIHNRYAGKIASFEHPSDVTGGAPRTMMLKNIPNRVTREELLDEISSKMPAGSFDFLYLPVDFKSKAGFGYAFVNCTSDEAVGMIVAGFHKRRLACAGGIYSKPLEVTIARVQGFSANVNRLISSPVLFQADDGSLPLIFNRNQTSIPFKALMQWNRASVMYQTTRPPIEDLMAMVESEMINH